jgi:HEAT repeat protein
MGQSILPTPATIIELLLHSDWEIRAQAAKAAGISGSSHFLEPLNISVQDEFWWVRYYSARSLSRIEGRVPQLQEVPI